MATLIDSQLTKIKDIFLESAVKYKGQVLTTNNISIGQIPSIPSTPHINISFRSSQRTPEFTGVGDKKTSIYSLSFVIRVPQVLIETNKTKLQEITDDLNNFAIGYLDYLLDNYRYGSQSNNIWYMINQSGQSEVISLENNNFLLNINLEIINY